jgi:putative acetyltransferase
MSTFFIREETAQDQDGIRQMYRLAFGGAAVAKLADDLRETRDAVISLVAVKEDKVIGHIMLSRLKAPMKALTLAPLAVHPDFQRQGIGATLIRKGLDRAKQDGCTAVFVLGDTGYYERLGFTVNAAKGFSSPYGGEHFMVLSFDPDNTPATGQVIYPLPFSTLK